MKKKCEYKDCNREARYYMGWEIKGEKFFGLVCATHDKYLGRENLQRNAGWPLEQAIEFEKERED
jgi:hypothetical protein